MPPPVSVIADAPGPQARQRARILSVVTVVLVLGGLAFVMLRLNQNHQFDRKYWRDFETGSALRYFLTGLVNTVKVAATASLLSLLLGLVLAVGRLSSRRPLRFLAGTYVESFRCFPLVVLILVLDRLFARTDALEPLRSGFWVMVVGLTLYNSAVLCEVFRAGVVSLPNGQREAGLAIGLSRGQTMSTVLLPQAVRLMLPTIMNQIVTIVMDTSLARFVLYGELLTRGITFGSATQFGDYIKDQNQLQALFVTGAVYVLLCFALSRVTRYLERRQKRAPRVKVDPAAAAGVDEIALQALQTG